MEGFGNLLFRYLKGLLIKIFRVDNNIYFWLISLSVILFSPNIVLPLTAFHGMQCLKSACERGTIFQRKVYERGTYSVKDGV